MIALAAFGECHYITTPTIRDGWCPWASPLRRVPAWSDFRTTWKETIAVLTQSTEKYQQILQSARQLYESEPDWVTFFREILGVDGIVRREFTRMDDLTAFEKSPEYEQIQKWLVKLREQKNATDTESEPTRVITVRLPKSMHEYLRTEAHDLRTSMNKLCISKLLQVIEQDLIPTERSAGGPTRATKPAPQPATAGVAGNSGHAHLHGHNPIPSSQPVFRSASGF